MFRINELNSCGWCVSCRSWFHTQSSPAMFFYVCWRILQPILGHHILLARFAKLLLMWMVCADICRSLLNLTFSHSVLFHFFISSSVQQCDVFDWCSGTQTSLALLAPISGVIEELLVPDGQKVVAGQQLYKLRQTGGWPLSFPELRGPASPSVTRWYGFLEWSCIFWQAVMTAFPYGQVPSWRLV